MGFPFILGIIKKNINGGKEDEKNHFGGFVIYNVLSILVT